MRSKRVRFYIVLLIIAPLILFLANGLTNNKFMSQEHQLHDVTFIKYLVD